LPKMYLCPLSGLFWHMYEKFRRMPIISLTTCIIYAMRYKFVGCIFLIHMASPLTKPTVGMDPESGRLTPYHPCSWRLAVSSVGPK
jgi:hypothetical protein